MIGNTKGRGALVSPQSAVRDGYYDRVEVRELGETVGESMAERVASASRAAKCQASRS